MPEAANGSFGGFAQKGFELAEGRLDRVEVGRIARQVTQRGAGGRDRFAHTGDLMGFEIVDDHDVTALEGREPGTVRDKRESLRRSSVH